MNNEERDKLLVGMGKDIGYIKGEMGKGADVFKDHEVRIKDVEVSTTATGRVSVLLLGAVGWLYKMALGGK